MRFNRPEIAACIQAHGTVVRVLVSGARGSVPRGPGAVMLVWQDGQSGTIGGGALEYRATEIARKMLVDGVPVMQRSEALGPAIDQCCGGRVDLVFEKFSMANLPQTGTEIFLRPVDKNAAKTMPQTVEQPITCPIMIAGWLAETLQAPTTPIWIFGAGHVGRATAMMLAPLSDFSVTLIDNAASRMPADLGENITLLTAPEMAGLVQHAPPNARHFVMTKSHRCDLEICHALLGHGFAAAGLIGSKTKWARFRAGLQKMGHSVDQIGRISCPIGTPALGKEPQAIAVGIVYGLLHR